MQRLFKINHRNGKDPLVGSIRAFDANEYPTIINARIRFREKDLSRINASTPTRSRDPAESGNPYRLSKTKRRNNFEFPIRSSVPHPVGKGTDLVRSEPFSRSGSPRFVLVTATQIYETVCREIESQTFRLSRGRKGSRKAGARARHSGRKQLKIASLKESTRSFGFFLLARARRNYHYRTYAAKCIFNFIKPQRLNTLGKHARETLLLLDQRPVITEATYRVEIGERFADCSLL